MRYFVFFFHTEASKSSIYSTLVPHLNMGAKFWLEKFDLHYINWQLKKQTHVSVVANIFKCVTLNLVFKFKTKFLCLTNHIPSSQWLHMAHAPKLATQDEHTQDPATLPSMKLSCTSSSNVGSRMGPKEETDFIWHPEPAIKEKKQW